MAFRDFFSDGKYFKKSYGMSFCFSHFQTMSIGMGVNLFFSFGRFSHWKCWTISYKPTGTRPTMCLSDCAHSFFYLTTDLLFHASNKSCCEPWVLLPTVDHSKHLWKTSFLLLFRLRKQQSEDFHVFCWAKMSWLATTFASCI